VWLWTEYVDLIYGTLFCVSTALGGSMGWAIAVVSLAARLALLPLTLRLAYRAVEMQVARQRLEPKVQKLRAKYKKDPRRLLEETAALYQENGIKVADGRSLLGTIAQTPVFLGLFGAVRRGLTAEGGFLWVRSLGAPDALFAGLCAIVAAWSAALAPTLSSSPKTPSIIVPALLTFIFLSRVAAGVSVYSLASGLVGLAQAALVRRHAVRTLQAGA
jgi:YidC/Oxa1 family membrane protein insertase